MDRSYYSASWFKVSDLKPKLGTHVRIHRQHFRGQLWYVLQDHSTGRYHRFSPAAYLVISLIQGGAGERGVGLITLLALFGAVRMLFYGQYPRDIFDLVLGFNRWSIRVVAYAALMTDEYPPFRLSE